MPLTLVMRLPLEEAPTSGFLVEAEVSVGSTGIAVSILNKHQETYVQTIIPMDELTKALQFFGVIPA